MGVHVGIISRVRNDTYQVCEIDTDYGGIKVGDVFELANTYCRDVVTQRKTMTYDDVAEITEMLKHPVYLATQLRAYIGTPIIIDNQVWGTLNFSSRIPRKPGFTDADYRFIESLAEQTAQHLHATNLATSDS
jgi:GAF domain-containing protein